MNSAKMAVTSEIAVLSLKKKAHFEPENARIEKYTLADELPEKLSELRLRPRDMTSARPGYSLRKLTAADKEPVLEFLRRFFFRDEPMNDAVKLLETPESRCIELEEYSATTLEEEVSFAAVDDRGEFVGIIINGVVEREDAGKPSDKNEEECPNPKFRRILKVLKHLDQEARIWDQLPHDCTKVLEVRIASTHTDWRGKGVAKALCYESEQLARKLGIGALRMDATSAFSAAVAERFGYRKVYTMKYADFPDAPVPKPPHLEARVYLKEL